jgi:Flp pilus assembly protein TadG
MRVMRRLRRETGTAILEVAMTLPILVLVAVGLFEFGRAFQTWQVLTNAAREGARLAVTPNATNGTVEQRVRDYMQNGQLPLYGSASVAVDRNATLTVNGTPESASQITVDYPFDFVVLNPVAQLVNYGSTTGSSPLTLRAQATMRNETQ